MHILTKWVTYDTFSLGHRYKRFVLIPHPSQGQISNALSPRRLRCQGLLITIITRLICTAKKNQNLFRSTFIIPSDSPPQIHHAKHHPQRRICVISLRPLIHKILPDDCHLKLRLRLKSHNFPSPLALLL